MERITKSQAQALETSSFWLSVLGLASVDIENKISSSSPSPEEQGAPVTNGKLISSVNEQNIGGRLARDCGFMDVVWSRLKCR